jgi:glycosyltransferase involved in cell wall biosynthesis
MAPEKVLAAFAPHVRSRVSVLPFVSRERHRELLMEHDIFVFPSLSEGFGLALAEAMGSEMACVTTLTGLAHDWLEHGQNCLIVPMSSPTGLSRAVMRLAHDAELRQVLGANAGRTVRELSWERFARETEAAYEARRARLVERA